MGLFDWGKKPKASVPDLHFKGTAEAFAYACDYMSSDIRERQALSAIIESGDGHQDAVQALIATFEDKAKENVFDTYRVRVSGVDGGFPAVALCYRKGLNLTAGTLVYWVPMNQDPIIATMSQDKRSAWIGGIVARLEPVFSTTGGGWKISEEYHAR